MKIISAVLFAALTIGTFMPVAQATQEKPYTAGAFFKDCLLIAGGSSLLLGASASALPSNNSPLFQNKYGKEAIGFIKNTNTTYLVGAIGFALLHRGISNMFKRS